mmetsp:Transcript_3424/g.8618  ORF Transcript_3424/g.8618 Transcript_3424/m.8618 type:complete len:175 (-) Transcript_3424:114-638(-)
MAPKRMWTGVWKVDKILAHRWNENGFEFLVRWAGCKRKGKPWEDSWERELSDDLKEHYFKSIELKESRMVTVDVRPLLAQTRKRVAAQVCAAKTQCRARVHYLTIEALTLRGLAIEFLELVHTPTLFYQWWSSTEDEQEHKYKKLPIHYYKDESDGVETWQVNYVKMAHVSAFC